ncbi:MAG: N-6 DNA methylase, partial [Thermaurantiacus sp.]
ADIPLGFDVMLDTVNAFAPELLAQRDGQPDPILYFYEDFLATFDPEARQKYGVYYTPVEVVEHMVEALDAALREHLGTRGLADEQVTLLDPAVGTGTFLLGVIEHVKREVARDQGPGMVGEAMRRLAARMFGFELLVGPYAVAHYRLHHAMGDLPGDRRVGVFLADTLARPTQDQQAPQLRVGFMGERIRAEREQAERVKGKQPILAIIGNPPYRRLAEGETGTLVGRWMDELWDDLKAPVREAGWGNQLNTFPELSVAFWRWALWKLFESPGATGRGVVAFITNRKFLTGKPYAGLRRMLRERFDRIDVLDLRGDARAGARAGIEGDEGVFNIMVGTAITLCVADGSRAGAGAVVRYADMWAEMRAGRSAKLERLRALARGAAPMAVAEVERGALDNLRPAAFANVAATSLREVFGFESSGVQTKRDEFTYGLTRDRLERRIRWFLGSDPAGQSRQFHETRDRKAIRAAGVPYDAGLLIEAAYRPLDVRTLYNHPAYADFPRPALQAVWGAANRCLYAMPFGTGAGRRRNASGIPEPSSGRRYRRNASVTSVPLSAMKASSIVRVLP